MLRPLVRLLIAQGITLPMFVRMLKVAYVETARRDFPIGDTPPTDSRVSVLTGVHRRDVRAIREAGDPAGTTRPTTLLATVVGRWLAGPDTVDDSGRPLPLPRVGREGPSFERLVAAVNTDVRARTVLDELMRQGLVTEAGDGLLTLARDAALGPDDAEQKVLFFARNLGDHLAAAAENLLEEEHPHLERAVFYNHLTERDVAELSDRSRGLVQELLVEINRDARARQSEAAERGEGTHRFRLGAYFYGTAMVLGADSPGDESGDEPDL